MLQIVRVEKVDEKIGVIYLVSMFPIWIMVCKLSKKMHFLQFCTDLSKKSNSVEAICIYASESSHYTLSENAMIYRGLSHHSWDISNQNIKKMVTQQKFLKDSLTSNTYTIETVSHSITNNISFWKCMTRPFRYIYVNCFNWLRYLVEVSTKLQKKHFLDNFRTITQEGSIETRQMISFFSSTFSNLFVIFIPEIENAQNSFSGGPPPLVHSTL